MAHRDRAAVNTTENAADPLWVRYINAARAEVSGLLAAPRPLNAAIEHSKLECARLFLLLARESIAPSHLSQGPESHRIPNLCEPRSRAPHPLAEGDDCATDQGYVESPLGPARQAFVPSALTECYTQVRYGEKATRASDTAGRVQGVRPGDCTRPEGRDQEGGGSGAESASQGAPQVKEHRQTKDLDVGPEQVQRGLNIIRDLNERRDYLTFFQSRNRLVEGYRQGRVSIIADFEAIYGGRPCEFSAVFDRPALYGHAQDNLITPLVVTNDSLNFHGTQNGRDKAMFVLDCEIMKRPKKVSVPSRVRLYHRFKYSDNPWAGPLFESLVYGTFKTLLTTPGWEMNVPVIANGFSCCSGSDEFEGVPQIVDCVSDDAGEKLGDCLLHPGNPNELFPALGLTLCGDAVWFSGEIRVNGKSSVADMFAAPVIF